MSRSKASKRVGFSPDINDHHATGFHKNMNSSTRLIQGITRKSFSGILTNFKLPNYDRGSRSVLTVNFFRGLSSKMAKVVRNVSSARPRSSFKVNNSASSFSRSRSVSDHSIFIDSHRAEAFEDCIEFLNSSSSCSSSLSRSNSVSGFSSY